MARSVDWRPLTFNGERHQIDLRIPGPDARKIVDRICLNLDDAEFSIAGVIVADIAVRGCPSEPSMVRSALRLKR